MSAGGAGCSPAASSRARMNRSMGDRGHRALATARRRCVRRHPECPELPRRFSPSRNGAAVSHRCRDVGGSGPGRPHLDPGGERLDLGRRELLLRRHRDVAFMANGEDQQALLRVAADDRRTGDSALQDRFERVHAQFALAGARIGTVAAEALLGQDRTDLVLEERGGRRWRGRILGDGAAREDAGDRHDCRYAHEVQGVPSGGGCR